MEYQKPFLSFEDQAELLIAREMSCDRDDLILHLQDIGYYRLSGYWHVFKNPDDTFVEGTRFSEVWDIYTFDRQLRLIALDAIERIEVYFRTQLAYRLSEATSPFGFLSNENLPRLDGKQYSELITKCENAIKHSREPFVLHFRKKYGDSHKLPPYWMLVNAIDFGTMQKFYQGAPVEVRNTIADELGVTAKVLESWLMTFRTVRNVCAHHGRLWNRTLGTKPMIPRKQSDPRWHEPVEVQSDKVFCVLTMLSFLLEKVAPETKWRKRLFSLFAMYPNIDQRRMGFPNGWENLHFGWHG